MDNASGQNKNSLVFAFAALLVKIGLFAKVLSSWFQLLPRRIIHSDPACDGQVTLAFLPVGHTHEDVDSVFGWVMRDLEKNTIVSPEDVVNLMNTLKSPDKHALPNKTGSEARLCKTAHSSPAQVETFGAGLMAFLVDRVLDWHHMLCALGLVSAKGKPAPSWFTGSTVDLRKFVFTMEDGNVTMQRFPCMSSQQPQDSRVLETLSDCTLHGLADATADAQQAPITVLTRNIKSVFQLPLITALSFAGHRL